MGGHHLDDGTLETMTPEQVHDELLRTKDQLEVAIGRLENRMMERFLAIEKRFVEIDGKFSQQRILLIVAIIGIFVQIINAWMLHKGS